MQVTLPLSHSKKDASRFFGCVCLIELIQFFKALNERINTEISMFVRKLPFTLTVVVG